MAGLLPLHLDSGLPRQKRNKRQTALVQAPSGSSLRSSESSRANNSGRGWWGKSAARSERRASKQRSAAAAAAAVAAALSLLRASPLAHSRAHALLLGFVPCLPLPARHVPYIPTCTSSPSIPPSILPPSPSLPPPPPSPPPSTPS